MTSAALPALHLPLQEVGSVLSSLCRLFSWAPTELDDARQHLIRYAEERFGKPLLSAGSVEDLEERLDRVVADEQLFPRFASLLDDRTLGELEEFLRRTHPRQFPILDSMRGWLDSDGLLALEDCERYSLAVLRALSALDAQYSLNMKAAMRHVAAIDLSSLWTDPSIPPVVARGNIGSLQASLCMMALAQGVAAKRAIEPWLVKALLQKWRDGLHAYLIVLASLSDVAVDENVVPAHERVDLEDAIGRTAVVKTRDEDLLRQARTANARLHPVPDED